MLGTGAANSCSPLSEGISGSFSYQIPVLDDIVTGWASRSSLSSFCVWAQCAAWLRLSPPSFARALCGCTSLCWGQFRVHTRPCTQLSRRAGNLPRLEDLFWAIQTSRAAAAYLTGEYGLSSWIISDVVQFNNYYSIIPTKKLRSRISSPNRALTMLI